MNESLFIGEFSSWHIHIHTVHAQQIEQKLKYIYFITRSIRNAASKCPKESNHTGIDLQSGLNRYLKP